MGGNLSQHLRADVPGFLVESFHRFAPGLQGEGSKYILTLPFPKRESQGLGFCLQADLWCVW